MVYTLVTTQESPDRIGRNVGRSPSHRRAPDDPDDPASFNGDDRPPNWPIAVTHRSIVAELVVVIALIAMAVATYLLSQTSTSNVAQAVGGG